jgi:nucleoside-diphosphate-sugar epimerase
VVTEETPFGPRGHRHFGYYARAKVLAEQLVWQWNAKGDVPATVLRPAWIYGPHDEGILPPLVRFLRSPTAHWPSRADACVDPIYVTDVAACALAAAQTSAAAGQAYNVAPEREIHLREFVSALCRALNIPPPRRSLPYALTASASRLSELWACLTFRRTAPTYTRAGLAILTQDIHHSSARAQRDLHWRPKTDVTEGVRLTAAWLRERFPS